MQDDERLNVDERELVQSLAGLMAAEPDVSEQSIWYQAGVRKGRRRVAVWRGVAAAIIVAAGGVVAWRPSATPIYVDRVVFQAASTVAGDGATQGVTTRAGSVASIDLMPLRDAVEQYGLDALPRAAGEGVLSQPSQSAWSSRATGAAPSPWDAVNTKG